MRRATVFRPLSCLTRRRDRGIRRRSGTTPSPGSAPEALKSPSPARLLFTRVDINIGAVVDRPRTIVRSPGHSSHRARGVLAHAAPATRVLARSPPARSEFLIRYAWQAFDRDGGQRIYLASDEPILLMSREFRKFAETEPLLFSSCGSTRMATASAGCRTRCGCRWTRAAT